MITCPNCHAQLSDDAKFCGNCATPLTPEAAHQKPKTEEDEFVGKCIDNKYYIVKRMASGGMGVVYLAKQKGVGQEVAIKKLHHQYYRDPQIVERFVNEARSYAKITHPNAVKLHDLLNVDGQLCLVMEFVHGKTLTSYIEEGCVFTIRQIIDISLQLADALATAHQAGIIHRDLKTENVMLLETVKGRYSVKILDFGIAKMMDKPSGKHETQEGLIVGTPEYMSPEQCYGKHIDHRVDIYAFGILMFAMISGKLPFVSDTALAMIQMQLNEPIPPCKRPNGSETPKELEAIVRKCMAKNADDRYQNFADVITDLMCIQEGKPIKLADVQDESPLSAEEIAQTHDISDSSSETDEDNSEAETSSLSPKKSSIIFGKLDLSEENSEEDDFQFSLDKGEQSLNIVDDADDDDEKDSGSFSEEEGFSIGDPSTVDEVLESHSQSEPKRGKGGIIGVIIILLLIGGGYYLVKSGIIQISMPQEKEAPVLPQALETKAEPIPVKDPSEESKPSVQAAAPDVKPKEPDPVPASEIASRQNIERGMLRAALRQADTRLNAGELEKAANLVTYITPKKDSLQGADAEKFTSVSAKKEQFNEINTKATQAAKSYSCSNITKMIESIPEEAEGMRNQLQKQAAKCESNASRPPSTL